MAKKCYGTYIEFDLLDDSLNPKLAMERALNLCTSILHYRIVNFHELQKTFHKEVLPKIVRPSQMQHESDYD